MPEQAPAASPMSEYTVMSWHWLVWLVRCVPSPCVPPGHRPAMAPVASSANSRGRPTMAAFSGFFSGTLITSIEKSAVFGSSFGSRPEHPASSSPDRTVLVPDP